MTKGATITLIVIVILVVGGLVYWYSMGSSTMDMDMTPTATTTTPGDNSGAAVTTTTTTDTSTSGGLGVGLSVSSTVVGGTTASPVSIAIQNFAFSPATMTVKKGTTITWTNADTAPHTVTGDNGGPASGQLKQGQSYSYTFNTVGSFPYHCAVHPYMKATITVTN